MTSLCCTTWIFHSRFFIFYKHICCDLYVAEKCSLSIYVWLAKPNMCSRWFFKKCHMRASKTIDWHAILENKKQFLMFSFSLFCRKNNYYYRNLHKKKLHAIFLRWAITGRVLSLGKQVVIAVKWKLCVDFLLNDGVDHMTAFTSKHVNGFPSRAYYFRNEMSSVQSIYNEETSEWKRYDDGWGERWRRISIPLQRLCQHEK